MSKIKVELAYLHAPHFHIGVADSQGVNLSDRLDTRDLKRSGMLLEWDTEEKELAITYLGRIGFVPESNVKSYFPFIETTTPKAQKLMPVKRTAQVSTPQDHVFAGPGNGKTHS